MPSSTWIMFRTALAQSVTPEQVARLIMAPMTVEGPAVIGGLVRAARAEPIVSPAFEFHDHLSLSMYSASDRPDAVSDYHPLVAAVLLECKVSAPDRFSFGVSDPLGLLIFASARYSHILPRDPFSEALESLHGLCVDPGSRAVLDAGVRVASSLLPAGSRKPKLSEAALVAADCRATIDTDCEMAGRAFWDWLRRTT